KGFRVAAARGLNHRSLGSEELQFSSSAVKQVLERGSFLLTDNAQLDSRLQQKKSVVQYQLKSILALPLEIEGEVEGVLYLDHRYRPDRFSEQDLALLTAFTAQAALAIDKARMLQDLTRARHELESKVESQSKRIEILSTELAEVRDDLKYEYREIVGQSPAMMQVFQWLDHVTETSIPVWIFGESGTGKELIARSLHFNSARKSSPFVTENVSAIPETLLESELFGHKRGAFTHADRDRIGLFEQANGGTLFLDEVADMPLGMQAKLLRVLQEGEVRPLGASKKVKVDVRLVTASNRDLAQMVKEEKFRQDLFFRINGMTLKLPPLRERREDIPILATHLIKKIARDFGLQTSEIGDAAYQRLLGHSWPGNIRELENVLRNALLFAKGRLLEPAHLILASVAPEGTGGRQAAAAISEESSAERELIVETLRRHRMDKEAAAEELGISLRTLYSRMERLKIPKKKTVLAKVLGLAAT
ncbi:MAG TPA: sigma-54-dependent Fis family transcriptional regulator, partial [bacterium]|nr:sigma-54-dependent Fis family transcriptional regulator [bacterium]